MLVGGAVLPLEDGLIVCRRDGIDRFCLVVDINIELVAPAGGIAVRRPREHDAVGLAFGIRSAHRHPSCGADCDRGFAIRPLGVFIPAVGHDIHIVAQG